MNLSVAFKGKGNSSYRLVSALNGDKYFLTNSYCGLCKDIDALHQHYDTVYMFGLDKERKGNIRIERCAMQNNMIVMSQLDIESLSTALNENGLSAFIGTHPHRSLCNDAYWHMLKKFNGRVVFFHIPSVKYITDSFITNIEKALYR